jgi:multidrug efflux pump subunit AcrA (membrane-fusion protein)
MKQPRFQRSLRLLLTLFVLPGVAFLVLRGRHAHADLNIPTATAKKGPFLVFVRCRGVLEARRRVELTAPLDVPDLQIVWLAPVNKQVQEGEVVIRFDGSKLQQNLREKTEGLKQAQASLDQALAQAKIDADQDNLDLAKAKADMEKARLEASKQAIVSTIQGEESTIDFKMAEEKVKVQQATAALHASSNSAKIASQRRLRDQAKSELALVQRRLEQINVRTPISGVVTYLTNTTQGWMNAQNYKVGDHAYSGAAIAQIPDLSTLGMESKVDEEDRGRIALNETAIIHVDAFPEQTLDAKLVSISPLTEQSFEEWPPTRTFRAFAFLKNADPRMRPGMNAGADIVERKLQDAISIPARGLFTLHGKPTVYVKRESAFEPREVRIQERNPDQVAVVGIAAGDKIALVQPGAQS